MRRAKWIVLLPTVAVFAAAAVHANSLIGDFHVDTPWNLAYGYGKFTDFAQGPTIAVGQRPGQNAVLLDADAASITPRRDHAVLELEQTCTVTSTADDGSPGTLRYAVDNANAGDTITFCLPDPSTIALNGTALNVNQSISISGPGRSALRVTQVVPYVGDPHDFFDLGANVDFTLSGMTLATSLPLASSDSTGIGIHDGSGGGTIIVRDMVFTGISYAIAAGYFGHLIVDHTQIDNVNGEAIDTAYSSLTVTDSSFISPFDGSTMAPGHGYGIDALSMVSTTLTNVTIAGRFLEGMVIRGGTSVVDHVTSVGSELGLEMGTDGVDPASILVKNSLFANSKNCHYTTVYEPLTLTSGGYNLVSNSDCGFNGPGEIVGLDPKLNALADNGGPGETFALAPDSPAVDAVPVANCTDAAGNPLTTDERGSVRPSGSACDIGAYELLQGPHTIAVASNPAAGGSVTCTPNPVAYRGSSTCTATANAGYVFNAFSGDCSGSTCTLSNITSDKSVTGNFTLITYSVTYASNPVAGGSVTCTPNPVAYGGSSTCTATANAGYIFSAFSGDCSGSTCTLSNVTSDKSVTGNFTLITYSVTYDGNGNTGGSVPVDGNAYVPGASVTVASAGTLTKTGYLFAGWNTAANGSGSSYAAGSTYTMGSANAVLYAQWTTQTFAIVTSANPPAGGSVSCTPNPVAYGGSSTCTATANTGYVFSAFSDDCSGSTCTLSNVTSAKKVRANFTQTYTVTYNGNGNTGGSVPVDGTAYLPGASVTVASAGTLTKTGYLFAGWNTAANGSGSSYAAGSSYTMGSANAVLYAQWTTQTFAIATAASPVAGGSVSCTPNPVAYGGSSTCTATANAGYVFSAFSGDCSGSTCSLTSVTAAKSVTGNFTQTYTVTYNGNGNTGGSVPVDGTSYLPGVSVTVASAGTLTKTGYLFAGWNTAANGSGSSYAAGSSYTMGSANAVLYAQWTTQTFAIATAASPVAGGSVSCTPNPVAYGGSTTCTATANAGYVFSAWSGDCSGTDPQCSLSNVSATTSVIAAFSALPIAIHSVPLADWRCLALMGLLLLVCAARHLES